MTQTEKLHPAAIERADCIIGSLVEELSTSDLDGLRRRIIEVVEGLRQRVKQKERVIDVYQMDLDNLVADMRAVLEKVEGR